MEGKASLCLMLNRHVYGIDHAVEIVGTLAKTQPVVNIRSALNKFRAPNAAEGPRLRRR
jgi:hypothetical protein